MFEDLQRKYLADRQLREEATQNWIRGSIDNLTRSDLISDPALRREIRAKNAWSPHRTDPEQILPSAAQLALAPAVALILETAAIGSVQWNVPDYADIMRRGVRELRTQDWFLASVDERDIAVRAIATQYAFGRADHIGVHNEEMLAKTQETHSNAVRALKRAEGPGSGTTVTVLTHVALGEALLYIRSDSERVRASVRHFNIALLLPERQTRIGAAIADMDAFRTLYKDTHYASEQRAIGRLVHGETRFQMRDGTRSHVSALIAGANGLADCAKGGLTLYPAQIMASIEIRSM
jgi:hypothetical protein